MNSSASISRFLRRTAIVTTLAVTTSLTAACNPINPIVDKRGYVPDAERLSSIQIGVDNKDSVYSRLGSPSTDATFGGDVWYYISSRHERIAFMAPKVTERQVVAIQFDQEDMVADIGHYGLEDGQIISYVERRTPTRGKELTFLEQIFGNLGRLPAPGNNQGGQ